MTCTHSGQEFEVDENAKDACHWHYGTNVPPSNSKNLMIYQARELWVLITIFGITGPDILLDPWKTTKRNILKDLCGLVAALKAMKEKDVRPGVIRSVRGRREICIDTRT